MIVIPLTILCIDIPKKIVNEPQEGRRIAPLYTVKCVQTDDEIGRAIVLQNDKIYVS